MFTHSCQLVLWADWHLLKMGCLRKPECRAVSVEGRESHFLSGPSLKKGQKQSNINHSALHSIPSAIVTEQTSGKRPVAGGNIKTSDS